MFGVGLPFQSVVHGASAVFVNHPQNIHQLVLYATDLDLPQRIMLLCRGIEFEWFYNSPSAPVLQIQGPINERKYLSERARQNIICLFVRTEFKCVDFEIEKDVSAQYVDLKVPPRSIVELVCESALESSRVFRLKVLEGFGSLGIVIGLGLLLRQVFAFSQDVVHLLMRIPTQTGRNSFKWLSGHGILRKIARELYQSPTASQVKPRLMSQVATEYGS